MLTATFSDLIRLYRSSSASGSARFIEPTDELRTVIENIAVNDEANLTGLEIEKVGTGYNLTFRAPAFKFGRFYRTFEQCVKADLINANRPMGQTPFYVVDSDFFSGENQAPLLSAYQSVKALLSAVINTAFYDNHVERECVIVSNHEALKSPAVVLSYGLEKATRNRIAFDVLMEMLVKMGVEEYGEMQQHIDKLTELLNREVSEELQQMKSAILIELKQTNDELHFLDVLKNITLTALTLESALLDEPA